MPRLGIEKYKQRVAIYEEVREVEKRNHMKTLSVFNLEMLSSSKSGIKFLFEHALRIQNQTSFESALR